MKSTFTVLFIIQKGKPKADGRVPIIARITINGKMSHFSTKFDILGKSSVRCPLKPSDSIPLCQNNPAPLIPI
ncbi:Arm DNA-binding domain-containing protein [Parabacteroides provencensis]|uniref:Arm DNA-binding domain-containing protein n=1 Tax=Parabacteroides provencensis TaxID=1944636 RepID=UPI000C152C76|nr:Arm DNA-binding domain-containing protein [Parabacteroides provencensis]